MAKSKKKDSAKKYALQARKEAKSDKKAQKRMRKEQEAQNGSDNDDGESNRTNTQNDMDDIENLLKAYQKQNLELSSPIIETIYQSTATEAGGDNETLAFPYPPRGNFTFTLCPTSNEIYLFGGEYYNGVENVIFDELLCWNPDAKIQQKNHDDDVKNSDTIPQQNIGIWKRIISPQPRPPARCSHSTVYYNNALYVFGGEFATADNYHHYKDLWKFDMKTNQWSEIKPRNRGGPSSRSGHRSLVWRHYMIIFGGFFEAVREAPRWFNDLYVYDFSNNSWIECSYSKLASLPPERSAFNFGLFTGTDVAYVSGGFSKIKNPAPGSKAEGIVYTDSWALHLKNLEQGKTPTWERLSRKGEYPSQRSGTSCVTWKNKMLVFGGVQDEETDNHKVRSVFYDDLFAFDMDRKRWFKLSLKKKGGERRRRRKNNVDNEEGEELEELEIQRDDDEDDIDDQEIQDGEAISNGWDLDKLRENMFAFIDAEGNIVYEKIEPDENDEEDKNLSGQNLDSVHEESEPDAGYEADVGDTSEQNQGNMKDTKESSSVSVSISDQILASTKDPTRAISFVPPVGKSEVMTLNREGKPEAVSRNIPLPRISAQVVVRGNTMFLYGGILEVGDREVTLDDCWSIDLHKREKWTCIWNGSMYKQVWKGAESDNESYISTDRGTGGMESDDEDEFEEFEDELDEAAKAEAKAARKAVRKEAKKEKIKGIREEIKELNEKLSLDNVHRTPQAEEDLATFYARTATFWEQQASEMIANEMATNSITNNDELSRKEMKRKGFNLARERYEELKPVLDRLNELGSAQQETEEKKKSKKASKKKKSSKDSRR